MTEPILDDRGAILAIVLLVMLATITLGVYVLKASSMDLGIAGNEREYKKSFYLAEEAVTVAISETSFWTTKPSEYKSSVSGTSVTVSKGETGRPPIGSGWSVSALQAQYFTIDANDSQSQTGITAGAWKVIPKMR